MSDADVLAWHAALRWARRTNPEKFGNDSPAERQAAIITAEKERRGLR